MKKHVILAVVVSLASLGGALSLEAAPPTPPAKTPVAAAAAPAKSAHSKTKAHHAKTSKKHPTGHHSSSPAK